MSRAYTKGYVCGCGSPVSDRSKSGLCRACYMKQLCNAPGRGEKISRALKERLKDPANRAKFREAARKAGITKRLNPEWRANAARIMREVVQPISVATGANLDRDYQAMSRKGLEARWAWCPEEYREAYCEIRAKGVKKTEARRIIREQIARDNRREADSLSPFEKQMRALERGARLVANDLKPSLANPGVYGDAA